MNCNKRNIPNKWQHPYSHAIFGQNDLLLFGLHIKWKLNEAYKNKTLMLSDLC